MPEGVGQLHDASPGGLADGAFLSGACRERTGERGIQVFDDDIAALVDDALASGADRIQVKRLRVVAGTEGPQEADLTVSIDGDERQARATGDGPVDAVFNAIRDLSPHTAVLRLFQVHAVTAGTDA